MFELMNELMAKLFGRAGFTRWYKQLDLEQRSTGLLRKKFSSNVDTVTDYKQPVLIEKDDEITLIGLNRPNFRNTIDNKTAECLNEAISTFEEDNGSSIAVIYGIGGSLCTGQDLTELNDEHENKVALEKYSALCKTGLLIRHPRKPLVCAINGFCVADGLELALFCDLRVMEDTAILGFFGRPIGLTLECGGAARLPAIIGHSRSLDLLLTGRRVGGKEALQIGLANRLVATGSALGQAVSLAFSIAKFPNESRQRDRKNIHINYYERRKGFWPAIRNETLLLESNVLREIKEGCDRFKKSKIKGSKTDSWQVKPKALAIWEQEEILHEQNHNFK